MVKSQFKTFGFWFILIITLFFYLLLLSAFTQTFLDFKIINMSMRTDRERLFQFLLPTTAILLFGSQIWRDAKIITIDTISKTITFTNFFTRRHLTYFFRDFDGFIDMYQKAKYSNYRVLYLVKDKKFIEKVSSFYYSNLDQIQDALAPTKYLGLQKYSFFKSLKVLFDKQVMD